jgi:outer membrane receptor protein involved in Fe transport
MDQFEGLYNFDSIIPVVDVQAGASYRLYRLNSDGTIFDDRDKKITIGQWGMFVQATKKLRRLKLTGAIRYDKTQNFAGKWTPRVAAVYTVAPDNNIRVSYQTGYQLPTNQDQYIDLTTQQGRLIGGLPRFISHYQLDDNPGFLVTDVEAYRDRYEKEYQANLQAGETSDEAAYRAAVSSEGVLRDTHGDYRLYRFRRLQPETVHSLEVGYRGIIGRKKKLALDAYVYGCNYTNMLVSIFVVQPLDGPQPIAGSGNPTPFYGPQLISDSAKNYQTWTNSTGAIKTWGWALGGEYELPEGFRLSGNVSYIQLLHVPAGVFTQLNTPAYSVNTGIGKTDIWKGLGFGINWRYQTGYQYEGSFAIGNIPAVSTLDAEIHYRIPRWKLLLKLGGTNILNHYYRNAFGNSLIGGLYYAEAAYNVF